MTKRILRAVLALAVCMGCLTPCAVEGADGAQITVASVSVDDTGYGEISGYISDYDKDTQITCLVMSGPKSDNGTMITNDSIIWIDQMTVGRNGVFLFTYFVPSKWSKQEAIVRVGGTGVTTPYNGTCTIPELPPDIGNVVNNSVLYGQDVYTLDSVYLTYDYVADSIVNGGNVIYFKIGDHWYNLLDSTATSNAYLVEANAVNDSEVARLPLRWYYVHARRVDFAQ